MNRRTFFKITAGLTALFSGIKAFAIQGSHPDLTSLDRVCVRRLIVNIKKFIAQTGENYVFETNTQETRDAFSKVINDYLESVKERKGLESYYLKCDETNNPPDVTNQNILYGELFIQPRKSVEWIVLDFNIIPPTIEKDFDLTGWDYVDDPLPEYKIKVV